jgi:hypothetical protein
MSYEDFGIGVLRVSPEMLAEFAAQKPNGLEVIGSVHCHNTQNPGIMLIVKGPMIPTIPGKSGIPEIDCLVTKLEDGSLEWDFTAK